MQRHSKEIRILREIQKVTHGIVETKTKKKQENKNVEVHIFDNPGRITRME